MRKIVIGDIHGAYKAMLQVLTRAGFKREEDMLIGLGDYADGYPDVIEVFEFLMTLPHFKGVIGNHDFWFRNYLNQKLGIREFKELWQPQGGRATLESFLKREDNLPVQDFLNSLPYFLVEDNKLFVHGGVAMTGKGIDLDGYSGWETTWDRRIASAVMLRILGYDTSGLFSFTVQPYDELYLGHTPTQRARPDFTPIIYDNIYLLDQGAGWNGKLTAMDIETHEYWQSDFTPELYRGIQGRG